MEENELIDGFSFESKEVYDRAKMEKNVINKIKETTDLSDLKTVLKLYNKATKENSFNTVIGQMFLAKLRETLVENQVMMPEDLTPIYVQDRKIVITDHEKTSYEEEKLKDKLEDLKIKHKKLRIAFIAFLVMLIGFVVINFRFQYSIFTYFTNYKATMEEELINKYEEWQEDLEQREKKLNQK